MCRLEIENGDLLGIITTILPISLTMANSTLRLQLDGSIHVVKAMDSVNVCFMSSNSHTAYLDSEDLRISI